MVLTYTSLTQIKIQNSNYFLPWLYQNGPENNFYNSLHASIAQFGILAPIVVAKDSDQKLSLIDGFWRLKCAQNLGLQKIHCLILNEEFTKNDIAKIILINRYQKISNSLINKLRFLKFLLHLKLDQQIIMENFFSALDFPSNDDFYQKCVKIANLFEPFLTFLDEKQFSFKQCVKLASYPTELIEKLFSWHEELNFSASIMLELAENIADYQKLTEKSLSALFSAPEITSILNETIASNEKIKLIRDYFREKRLPTLTKVNQQITTLKKELNLSSQTDLIWDKSLEKKEIEITLKITETGQWPNIIKQLNSDKTASNLKKILDLL